MQNITLTTILPTVKGGGGKKQPVATPENSITILGNVVVTERPLSDNELKFIRRVNRTGTLPPKIARVPKKVLKMTGLLDNLPDALLIGLGFGDLIEKMAKFFRVRRKIGEQLFKRPFHTLFGSKKRHVVQAPINNNELRRRTNKQPEKSKTANNILVQTLNLWIGWWQSIF